MNFQRLSYFLTLADNLSFTKTANQHYVSQTAITQQIQLLEQELGIQLFDRTNRKVVLTPSGKAYYESIRQLPNYLSIAKDRAILANSSQDGVLKIGYANTLQSTLMIPLLRNFQKIHPNVNYSFSLIDEVSSFDRLSFLNHDLIFHLFFHHSLEDELTFIPIKKCQQFVVVSPLHPLSQFSYINRKDLMNEKIVSFDESQEAKEHIEQDFKQSGIMPTFIHCDSINTAFLNIEFNNCIGVFADFVIDEISSKYNLVYVPLKDDFIYAQCSYKTKTDNPLILEFIQFIKEYLKNVQ